jgi:hypothetical protein
VVKERTGKFIVGGVIDGIPRGSATRTGFTKRNQPPNQHRPIKTMVLVGIYIPDRAFLSFL